MAHTRRWQALVFILVVPRLVYVYVVIVSAADRKPSLYLIYAVVHHHKHSLRVTVGLGAFSSTTTTSTITLRPLSAANQSTVTGKKNRMTYSKAQSVVLEMKFRDNPYINKAQRIELRDQTALNDRQIKIWFQNRRMKEKKEKQRTGTSIGTDPTLPANPPPPTKTAVIDLQQLDDDDQTPASRHYYYMSAPSSGVYHQPAAYPSLYQQHQTTMKMDHHWLD
jgi:hypothetical protein